MARIRDARHSGTKEKINAVTKTMDAAWLHNSVGAERRCEVLSQEAARTSTVQLRGNTMRSRHNNKTRETKKIDDITAHDLLSFGNNTFTKPFFLSLESNHNLLFPGSSMTQRNSLGISEKTLNEQCSRTYSKGTLLKSR